MERKKGGRKGSRRERKERRKGERERKKERKREERRKEGGIKKTGIHTINFTFLTTGAVFLFENVFKSPTIFNINYDSQTHSHHSQYC